MSNVSSDAVNGKSKIVEINEDFLSSHIDQKIKGAIQETINAMLENEAEQLCNAKPHERTEDRTAYRSGKYQRQYQTRVGSVKLNIPKLKGLKFQTQIIERYQRRESSVEEALIEMYLAGVSVRRVEDITQALFGEKVSASVVSDLNKKLYTRLDEWLNRPIEGEYPYVYVDGTYLKKCWAGAVRNVAILVAIGVDQDGYREVLGVQEGASESVESWKTFFRYLVARGLKGVKLITSDAHEGIKQSYPAFFPDAMWQRCIVHWYRNALSKVPKQKRQEVAEMLKAIQAQDTRLSALEKTLDIAEKLRAMKLPKVADFILSTILETLTYFSFPISHRKRIRTNNGLERMMREIKRRSKVVGAFPDGNSAVMLAAARLRHVARSTWSSRKYLNMDSLVGLNPPSLSLLSDDEKNVLKQIEALVA